MDLRFTRLGTPRVAGVICVTAATGLGMLYMAAAGAPAMYPAVNGLSLVIGLALMALMRPAARGWALHGPATVVFACLLLATALFGTSVDGASRWLQVAGLSLQVSIVVLPVMLVSFARSSSVVAAIGVMLAAVALALQPDRAMAGVLALALLVLWFHRRDRAVVAALAIAVAGFATTLLRPDNLPAAEYVEGILYTAFHVHPLAGIAVVGGALLLIIPGVVGLATDPENRAVHAVFGAVWLGIVVAAALGNYPTPVVGYGASAILGYALSLGLLPRAARSARSAAHAVDESR